VPRSIVEMRDLPDEELLVRLESSKEELFNLRFQLATGQLDNPMRIKHVRHDVARILTVLRERSVDPAADETAAPAPAVAQPETEPKPKRRRREPEPEPVAPQAEAVPDEPIVEAVTAGETERVGVEAAEISDEDLEAEALAAGDEGETEDAASGEEPTKRRGLLRRKRGDA
jgi:large subunit ribosomal protein L29